MSTYVISLLEFLKDLRTKFQWSVSAKVVNGMKGVEDTVKSLKGLKYHLK